jgi:hypothetical protein
MQDPCGVSVGILIVLQTGSLRTKQATRDCSVSAYRRRLNSGWGAALYSFGYSTTDRRRPSPALSV